MAKAPKSLLAELDPLEPYENEKTVAFKTVDTFAGITQRKLWLIHDPKGYPRTDGHGITLDLNDPDMYRWVEHELSHILFKSDFIAKAKFVSTYSTLMVSAAYKLGYQLNVVQVSKVLDFTFNLLEDQRVNSLWGMLYPGSAALLKDLHRTITDTYAAKAAGSYMHYFACIAGGSYMRTGPLDVYRHLFESALQKVERKGFLATMVVSKWLVTNLVSEIIRQTRTSPSDADITPAERIAGLFELMKKVQVDPKLSEKKDDLKESKYPEAGGAAKAQKMVADAMNADLGDEAQLSDLLADTQMEMQEITDHARAAIRPTVGKDDWLKKDSMAKVVFDDIRPSDAQTLPVPLASGDLDVIRRLKGVFVKIMGRRRSYLDDSGVEVDVQAYIERKISKMPVPCFRQEERGRGFKALILLDRSSSMAGTRTEQAERASRIIGKALKFPFVTVNVWGFRSRELGQVDIARFDPSMEVFATPKSEVDGGTPLHTAIRLAIRHLEFGAESKQLIVITDGNPNYQAKDGRAIPTKQLWMWVRQEVTYARRHGINVTCLMVGEHVAPEKLRLMFGSPRNWRILDEQRLGSDLLKVVTDSFVRYLQTR